MVHKTTVDRVRPCCSQTWSTNLVVKFSNHEAYFQEGTKRKKEIIGFRGVTKRGERYLAQLRVGDKYDTCTPKEAARAYDQTILKYNHSVTKSKSKKNQKKIKSRPTHNGYKKQHKLYYQKTHTQKVQINKVMYMYL